jgi:hypothetical protein
MVWMAWMAWFGFARPETGVSGRLLWNIPTN